MSEDIKMLTSAEVAKILRCSIPTARGIMKRKDFPLIRTGRCMKVSYTALLKWIESRHT